MRPDTITRSTMIGPRLHVEFTYNALEYEARIFKGEVLELHRVGGNPKTWTSISPSNPRRAKIIGALAQLLEVQNDHN